VVKDQDLHTVPRKMIANTLNSAADVSFDDTGTHSDILIHIVGLFTVELHDAFESEAYFFLVFEM